MPENSRALWSHVEHALLDAVQRPRTLAEVIACSGLPADTVKTELRDLTRAGLVLQTGAYYQVTSTGRTRLVELTHPATPDQHAAA